jgi:hypothetical protein
MSLWIGAYFFLIALALAHLEIQIEGPHGWAEMLPTRRWDGPAIRRWIGRPVTGYHLCLSMVLLLFLHVPQLYGGTWEREADLLAIFFLLTVTWDFLWFACNRHFGVARFRKGEVWWFPTWAFGVPRPYLTALAFSFAAAIAPALWTGGAWIPRARDWALVLAEVLVLTMAVVVVTHALRRRPATLAAGAKPGEE